MHYGGQPRGEREGGMLRIKTTLVTLRRFFHLVPVKLNEHGENNPGLLFISGDYNLSAKLVGIFGYHFPRDRFYKINPNK